MRLYLHHVGQEGAEEDFKKTVYRDISIEAVERNVSVREPHRDELLSQLKQEFPAGHFNCWGVPAGANAVISKLAAGGRVARLRLSSECGVHPIGCGALHVWENMPVDGEGY